MPIDADGYGGYASGLADIVADEERTGTGEEVCCAESVTGRSPSPVSAGTAMCAVMMLSAASTPVESIEKGIAKANLGLNPMIDGQNVRLPMPDLTEERRKELAKLAGKYAENAKIAIRNVRRDGMEALKEDEKNKDISEDEHKRMADEVQKLTDMHVGEADAAAAQKEKEILTQ